MLTGVRRWGLMALALGLPLLVWAGAWIAGGWVPHGDEGYMALRTQAVLSAHPPVQGMRSTSYLSVPGTYAHHLGPIQFYLLAIPYAISGWQPAGLLLGSTMLALAMTAIASAHASSLGGRRALGLVAAGALGSYLFFGPALLLPWNPLPAVLGLIALLVLSWRLFLGQMSALPWFVAVGSFDLQANLAVVPMLAPLLAVLTGTGLLRWYRSRGALWPLPGRAPETETTWWRRPGVIATVIAGLAWLPSVIELFVLSPNNASQLFELAVGSISPLRAVGVLVAALVGMWAIVRASRGRMTVRRALRWVAALFIVGVASAACVGGTGRVGYLFIGVGGAVFVVAALCLEVRLRWLGGGPRRRNKPASGTGVGATLFGLGLGLAALVISPSTHPLARLEYDAVRKANPVAEEAVARLRAQGITQGPVVIRATETFNGAWESFQSPVAARLGERGYSPFYDSLWPYQEDDEFRRIKKAPEGAPVLTIRGASITIQEDGSLE